MGKHIRIIEAEGLWVVRAAGAILGETNRGLELLEGDRPGVIYFPRDDIAMAFLEPSETSSRCPHKGTASYYSIVTKSGTITDAAWSYDAPLDAAAPIAGHLAFYPDKVTLERI